MSHASMPSSGVIQGSFWNGRPVWPVQARATGSVAVAPALAPHVRAALARTAPSPPVPPAVQKKTKTKKKEKDEIPDEEERDKIN